MLLTAFCPICRRPGGAPCAECAELFVPLGPIEPTPIGLDAAFAALAYAEAARPLITALKYRNQRGAIGWLAEAMVAVLPPGLPSPIVTWAPTTFARRRRRGFDQAEVLARAVARRLGVGPRCLLVRRPGVAQTGRGGADRRRDAPRFAPRRRVVSGRGPVLLVDDVATTGSTLAAAAAALRRGGATTVIGLVAAATPRPESRSH